MESIQFLREIIPERPSAAGSVVRNLTAAAGSEKVSLRWVTSLVRSVITVLVLLRRPPHWR